MNYGTSEDKNQALIDEFSKIILKKFHNKFNSSFERVRIFDPITTLYCFLMQTLLNGSCKTALAFLEAYKHRLNQKPPSKNTAAYSKARKRLDQILMEKIAFYIGQDNLKLTNRWQWKGRDVKLVDGSTLTMADTKENQQAFPQIRRQQPGLGFPILRLVGIFDLVSGSILNMGLAKYQGKGNGELSIFKKLLRRCSRNDLFVMDCLYGNHVMMDLMLRLKYDFVVKFKREKGRKLIGLKKSKIIQLKWRKCSNYLSEEETKEIREKITVRLVHIKVENKGYRTQSIYIATSLLDENKYTAEDIGELYKKRWGVETDIRNLKVTLEARHLKCKSPDMVLKELWAKVIIYNLIKRLIVISCHVCNTNASPREISFIDTKDRYLIMSLVDSARGIVALVERIATEKLKLRFRWEPRKRKMRVPNNLKFLTTPRQILKEIWANEREAHLFS